jgi:hypothetical protein
VGLNFFNLPNPSSHSMPLGLTHPLSEMNTQNTTSPPSLCRLSRRYAILDIIQPYRRPYPVVGIALFFPFITRTVWVNPLIAITYKSQLISANFLCSFMLKDCTKTGEQNVNFQVMENFFIPDYLGLERIHK